MIAEQLLLMEVGPDHLSSGSPEENRDEAGFFVARSGWRRQDKKSVEVIF